MNKFEKTLNDVAELMDLEEEDTGSKVEEEVYQSGVLIELDSIIGSDTGEKPLLTENLPPPTIQDIYPSFSLEPDPEIHMEIVLEEAVDVGKVETPSKKKRKKRNRSSQIKKNQEKNRIKEFAMQQANIQLAEEFEKIELDELPIITSESPQVKRLRIRDEKRKAHLDSIALKKAQQQKEDLRKHNAVQQKIREEREAKVPPNDLKEPYISQWRRGSQFFGEKTPMVSRDDLKTPYARKNFPEFFDDTSK